MISSSSSLSLCLYIYIYIICVCHLYVHLYTHIVVGLCIFGLMICGFDKYSDNRRNSWGSEGSGRYAPKEGRDG